MGKCPFCLTSCGHEHCSYANPKPCLKQEVYAIIKTSDYQFIRGSNYIYKDIIKCPRADMPSGQGYELCKSVCNQLHHAEVDAIEKAKCAGIDIAGAELTLIGHTYCCDDCIDAMRNANLKSYWIKGKEYLL